MSSLAVWKLQLSNPSSTTINSVQHQICERSAFTHTGCSAASDDTSDDQEIRAFTEEISDLLFSLEEE
jgi:hypothetical protein